MHKETKKSNLAAETVLIQCPPNSAFRKWKQSCCLAIEQEKSYSTSTKVDWGGRVCWTNVPLLFCIKYQPSPFPDSLNVATCKTLHTTELNSGQQALFIYIYKKKEQKRNENTLKTTSTECTSSHWLTHASQFRSPSPTSRLSFQTCIGQYYQNLDLIVITKQQSWTSTLPALLSYSLFLFAVVF